MKITRLSGEREWCNIFVLGEEGAPCLLFDFGDNANHKIERYVERHHSACLGLFLTHGHFDHISGLNQADRPFPYPVYLASEDIRSLEDPTFNCSFGFGLPLLKVKGIEPITFYDGEVVELGPFKVTCILTPFHTAGSACFYLEDQGLLISGDTLFRCGVGRDDLRGAEPRKKEQSLAKLAKLPKETKVYPGHGPSTTIGEEFFR